MVIQLRFQEEEAIFDQELSAGLLAAVDIFLDETLKPVQMKFIKKWDNI